MSQPPTIIVASFYKPAIALLERAMQGTVASVRQVDPTAEAVLKAVGDSKSPLVVLYARKGSEDWLRLAKALHDARPNLSMMAFGESGDVGAVARGMVNGLSSYAPMTFGSDLLETRRILANAIAGVDAPEDSIYGRVKAMLPSVKAGPAFFRAGRSVSAKEAIQQCVSLGLTNEETACFLGVGEDDVNKFASQVRRTPRVGQLELSGRLKVAGVVLIVGFALMGLLGRRRSKGLVPVTGTVTMNGVPLSDVIVHFSKQGGSHIASGKTDGSGRYQLSTLQKGDGAEAGSHVVWVSVPSPIREHIDMNDPQYAEKMVRLEERMRAERETGAKEDATSAPTSYRDMRTSPLRAEVRGRSPISLDFDLKK